MNEPSEADSLLESIALSAADIDSISDISRPFASDWQVVVSQTNWEKGKIISQWRSRLQESGVAPRLVSDAAWCRIVGELTPQHAGRLRRTWERFGESSRTYPGLYWSHFLAALEWHDAEMWLEGAVQNGWSVSKMRFQRWETSGAVESERPDPASIIASVADEGTRILPRPATVGETESASQNRTVRGTTGPLPERPDFGEENDLAHTMSGDDSSRRATGSDPAMESDRVDLEAVLQQLPAAIARPYRQLRAAILELRERQWKGTKRIHLVAIANDLRMLLRKSERTETGSEKNSQPAI